MNIVIRRAAEHDVPAIVGMAAKFYALTSYRRFAPFNPATVEQLARTLVESGVMLVAVDGVRHVGMVGMFLAPFMFNGEVRTAHEVCWWVEPFAQRSGIGRRLLRATEEACRDEGCAAIQMVYLASSPPEAAALYGSEGYAYSETCVTKEICPWPQ